MKHTEFFVGGEFTFGDGRWVCTDLGRRTVVAVRVDRMTRVRADGTTRTEEVVDPREADRSWFDGPPYALPEQVFDETTFGGCETAADQWPQPGDEFVADDATLHRVTDVVPGGGVTTRRVGKYYPIGPDPRTHAAAELEAARFARLQGRERLTASLT